MAIGLRQWWQVVSRRGYRPAPVARTAGAEQPAIATSPPVDIAPDDPIIAYFQGAPGVVEIDKLDIDSPALQTLKAAGVRVAVPLVSQGELVGLLNLGSRLSEQEYSADDRTLLNNLAGQAAPALRVAQLVQQQQAEALARERIEQELRVARLIQQTLLPKDVPALPGWQMAAIYQPARAVGGDFYDFLFFPDGRVGLVIGDVTDKGVPAALVMASTRSILRASASGEASPGVVLERVNDLLCPDMPPKMFVTCLYAILDPATGYIRYANAGHDLPYRRMETGVDELRATGMPLGLLPGMRYEEKEATLAPGETVLLYSDGLVEAHNPQYEMFSFPRLKELMAQHRGGLELIDFLLKELADFTGPDWEQEDDVTLVTLHRAATPATAALPEPAEPTVAGNGSSAWRTLAAFTLPSQAGNERLAMAQVAEAIASLGLPQARLERLKTAVAEATMNAIEHGNKFRAEVPVSIRVRASDSMIAVHITDQGGDAPIAAPAVPDLDAKLAGLQTPRGWGLFLIKNMVDDMRITTDGDQHTVALIMKLEGEGHDRAAP